MHVPVHPLEFTELPRSPKILMKALKVNDSAKCCNQAHEYLSLTCAAHMYTLTHTHTPPPPPTPTHHTHTHTHTNPYTEDTQDTHTHTHTQPSIKRQQRPVTNKKENGVIQHSPTLKSLYKEKKKKMTDCAKVLHPHTAHDHYFKRAENANRNSLASGFAGLWPSE